MRTHLIWLVATGTAAGVFSADNEPVLHKYSNQAGIMLTVPGSGGNLSCRKWLYDNFRLQASSALSYRKWFQDKYGIQVNGFYFSEKDEYRGIMRGYKRRQWASARVLGLYNFRDWRHARAMLYAGASCRLHDTLDRRQILLDSVWYDYPGSFREQHRSPFDSAETTSDVSLCSGFGIDYTWWRLGLSCMTGIRIGYSFSGKEIVMPGFTFDCGIYCLF